MDSVTRKLYHVCRGNRALPDALLPKNGWEIDRIDIGARTRDRGRLAAGAGGLIDIASMKFPRDMEALTDILAARDVGWVAALRPGQLEDISIRSLVRGRCMSYITLPTTPDELGYAVGHARTDSVNSLCGMMRGDAGADRATLCDRWHEGTRAGAGTKARKSPDSKWVKRC